MLLLPVFLGHKSIIQHALSSRVILACAKVTYFVALAHPIIIALLYNRGQHGMFVKLPVVLYLGLGNVFCETIFGLFSWIFLEYPIGRIIRLKNRWNFNNIEDQELKRSAFNNVKRNEHREDENIEDIK